MTGLDALRGSLLVHWGQSPRDVAKRASGLVYLATPYTKRAAPGGVFDWGAADRAARDAAECASILSFQGCTAVAPIVLAHQMIAVQLGTSRQKIAERNALDAAFWTRWCAPLLWACRFVYVPDLTGWRESEGIAHEIAQAHAYNKIIMFGARQ